MPAILLIVCLAPAWLGLLGDWYWGFDLLSHFRWQYLAASLVAVALTALGRRRILLAFAMLTLLLNAALIGRLALESGVRSGNAVPGFSLRVMSFNVLTSNLRRQATLDYLLQSDADVIVLLEVDDGWMTALAPLLQRYPHHVAHPADDNFGIALFSRVPVEQMGLLPLPAARTASVTATLTHAGRRLRIIGTHPVPPGSRGWSQARDAQLAMLAAQAMGTQEPVLVVGDLNATPWSRGLRILTRGNLQFRSLDAPWTPTWRARSPFAVPIDHAVCSAPLFIRARRVGPDLGSDHRPLMLDVAWESAAD